MTKPKNGTGRWPEFNDARGIDSKYTEEKAAAARELAEATAGPANPDVILPDDTKMKNPGGEFQSPSAMAVNQIAGVKPQDQARETPKSGATGDNRL
jgi:hypothetical protein